MKEEKEAERDKGPLAEPKGEAKKKDCSRRRQRSRSRSRRSRTRRRSREKKDKKRGSPSPEKKKEVDKKPTSPPAEEDDGVEVATEEEEEAAPEEIKDDAEANKRYSLTRTAKPSARKPLPRRPRTPSHSLPRYCEEEERKAPRWKGYKHVLRGQYYSNHGGGRGKGGGTGWRRK